MQAQRQLPMQQLRAPRDEAETARYVFSMVHDHRLIVSIAKSSPDP